MQKALHINSNRQLQETLTDCFGELQPTTSGGIEPTTSGGIESTVSPVVDDLFVCLCCCTGRLELTVRQGTVRRSLDKQRAYRDVFRVSS